MRLYTADTPNGSKASFMLGKIEVEYPYHSPDLGALEQRQDCLDVQELDSLGKIMVDLGRLEDSVNH